LKKGGGGEGKKTGVPQREKTSTNGGPMVLKSFNFQKHEKEERGGMEANARTKPRTHAQISQQKVQIRTEKGKRRGTSFAEKYFSTPRTQGKKEKRKHLLSWRGTSTVLKKGIQPLVVQERAGPEQGQRKPGGLPPSTVRTSEGVPWRKNPDRP